MKLSREHSQEISGILAKRRKNGVTVWNPEHGSIYKMLVPQRKTAALAILSKEENMEELWFSVKPPWAIPSGNLFWGSRGLPGKQKSISNNEQIRQKNILITLLSPYKTEIFSFCLL